MKGGESMRSTALASEKKKRGKKEEEEKDLKALIHGHSLFFDQLVELIPVRFYLPHDDDADKVWFHGLSKDARVSFKKQSQENLRMARKQRLDASTAAPSSVSTLELLKKSIANKKYSIQGGVPDDDPPEITASICEGQDHGGSVTYEELRQRLHRRIEERRGNRNTRDPTTRGEKGKKDKNTQRSKKGKDWGKGGREMNAGIGVKKLAGKKAEESGGDFAFGRVKIGGQEVDKKKGKKRKASKAQELERAKRQKEAMHDPEKGARFSAKHSWSAAASRAGGIKVHDDPKLLKQSIRKEKKRQQKSAKKWKERIEITEKNIATKQQARSENLAERAREKKMHRIAKREKKLMRPGFEGRKDGFVNES